jgi:hypothetical protein
MGNRRKGGVKPPQRPSNPRRLRFSFRYLQADHPKFDIKHCNSDYMAHLLRALQRYSSFTVDQFIEIDPSDQHRHPIHLSDSSEPRGFPSIDPDVDEDLWTDQVLQFALSEDKIAPRSAWRVHGFIYEDVFYVVWLDSQHNLFPTGWVEKDGKKLIHHSPPKKKT